MSTKVIQFNQKVKLSSIGLQTCGESTVTIQLNCLIRIGGLDIQTGFSALILIELNQSSERNAIGGFQREEKS